MTDLASITVTAGLGIAGLYLGQSLRRKTRAEIESNVAERRLSAYGDLWERTLLAAPMNTSALAAEEREKLYSSLTNWYFSSGNGMVMSEDTRSIYLTAKRNLTCDEHKLQPKSLCDEVAGAAAADQAAIRGAASVRQLSLLRTSMRADLLVYSGPWGQKLTRADRRFLSACGVRQWRRPWRPTLGRGASTATGDAAAEPPIGAGSATSEPTRTPHEAHTSRQRSA
jgi:hypothetical protein